jgi:mannosyl-3-phosphoglycerate phosphatase
MIFYGIYACNLPESLLASSIIYTDLDGTLLDAAYSFDAALPALRLVREKNIPLVICSSKTRAEIEHYRTMLGNRHPFISENGGGIFVPDGYFQPTVYGTQLSPDREKEYLVIRLGARYVELRRAVKELREKGFGIKGFGDMTVREIAALTGLSTEEAGMAKERDFDEPFVVDSRGHGLKELSEAVKAKGFTMTQGRFHHILGNSDKGKAVSILSDLFKRQIDGITTVGIGDSPNDLPMLQNVDIPVVVQKSDGSYDPNIRVPALARAQGIGPEGWNNFIRDWLSGSAG